MLEEKKKFNFKDWLRGKNRKERLENISFLLILISVAGIWVGMLLGSFIKYTVFVAAFGALLLLPAIIIYIISQLMEEKKSETAPAQGETSPQ